MLQHTGTVWETLVGYRQCLALAPKYSGSQTFLSHDPNRGSD